MSNLFTCVQDRLELECRVNRAVKLLERCHNEPDPQQAFQMRAQTATNSADRFAKQLGLKLDWSPGLYPTVVKDGQTFIVEW